MRDGRAADEEVPGSYNWVVFADQHRISVLVRTRRGGAFYRQLTAVIHAIHAAGPDTTYLHKLSYKISKQTLLLCARARHFAHGIVRASAGQIYARLDPL